MRLILRREAEFPLVQAKSLLPQSVEFGGVGGREPADRQRHGRGRILFRRISRSKARADLRIEAASCASRLALE
ncbi:hypothetical protein MSC49_07240 [Methylosinus sp. C49]|nr:hypothetical protein MSC49_07240 [Methylosinus sp. C49]